MSLNRHSNLAAVAAAGSAYLERQLDYFMSLNRNLSASVLAANLEYLEQQLIIIENEKTNELLILHIESVLAAKSDIKLLSLEEIAKYKNYIDTRLPIYSACKANEALHLHLHLVKAGNIAALSHPLTITDKILGSVYSFDSVAFIGGNIRGRIEEGITFEGKPLDREHYVFSKYPRKIEIYLASVRAALNSQPDLAPVAANSRLGFFSAALAEAKRLLDVKLLRNQQVAPFEISDTQGTNYARLA
ncbi:MAG: hypothetical protein V4501_00305 [Pseudomonadota bacterium]